MAGLTKAQRHNRMMDRIFSEAKRLEKDPVTKSYRRHQRNIGVAVKDKGSHYPGPKHKALDHAKGKFYTSPTGSKHKVGSNKHKYWMDIERAGKDSKKYGD